MSGPGFRVVGGSLQPQRGLSAEHKCPRYGPWADSPPWQRSALAPVAQRHPVCKWNRRIGGWSGCRRSCSAVRSGGRRTYKISWCLILGVEGIAIMGSTAKSCFGFGGTVRRLTHGRYISLHLILDPSKLGTRRPGPLLSVLSTHSTHLIYHLGPVGLLDFRPMANFTLPHELSICITHPYEYVSLTMPAKPKPPQRPRVTPAQRCQKITAARLRQLRQGAQSSARPLARFSTRKRESLSIHRTDR
jgi:hypothetical protein